MLADSYFTTVFEQKRQVEDAFSVSEERPENASDLELYMDGHLVPPPLESDCEVTYATV